MKNFLVAYRAPASVIGAWKQTAPADRMQAGEKMQAMTRIRRSAMHRPPRGCR